MIHPDIKPSNVLVSTVDGRPLAKVIDFAVKSPFVIATLSMRTGAPTTPAT